MDEHDQTKDSTPTLHTKSHGHATGSNIIRLQMPMSSSLRDVASQTMFSEGLQKKHYGY